MKSTTKGFGLEIAASVDQKPIDDPVELVARTVSYSLHGDLLYAVAYDFEVHEPGQQRQTSTPDPQEISVKFDAEFSKELAIEALELILDQIRRDGLPEVRTKMERRHATRVMKLQAEADEISEELAKVPIGFRAEMRRVVKSWIDSANRARLEKRTSAKP
jgi:hypothetical protein